MQSWGQYQPKTGTVTIASNVSLFSRKRTTKLEAWEKRYSVEGTHLCIFTRQFCIVLDNLLPIKFKVMKMVFRHCSISRKWDYLYEKFQNFLWPSNQVHIEWIFCLWHVAPILSALLSLVHLYNTGEERSQKDHCIWNSAYGLNYTVFFWTVIYSK